MRVLTALFAVAVAAGCALAQTFPTCSYGFGATLAEDGFDAAVTYLIDGAALNNKIRPNAEKVIFLVTDGAMTNPSQAVAAAKNAQNPPNNITVFCVGVDGANVLQMWNMASGTNGLLNGQKTTFFANNFADLPGIIDGLSTTVSGLFSCAGNPAGGTTGSSSPCKAQLDIFFVVDQSGSIDDSEWYNFMRPFLVQLSQIFELGPDKVQLGATFFSFNNTLKQPITDSATTWFGWLNNYPCVNSTGGSTSASTIASTGSSTTPPTSASTIASTSSSTIASTSSSTIRSSSFGTAATLISLFSFTFLSLT